MVPMTVERVSIGEGFGGTLDTLTLMRQLAREGSRMPDIRQGALNCIWLQPARFDLHEVRAIFEFVRDHIRYVRDPLHFESVATPSQTLLMKCGDCDDKSTLLAAMLESVGYPNRFVVTGYHDAQPEHVYLQVFANGEWINADATEKMPLGYAPPMPVFTHVERI